MSFVVSLIGLVNKEVISSYFTKEDAFCHAAGFSLEMINSDIEIILANENKKESLLKLIQEYDKQNYPEVLRLYNSSVKPYDSDPDIIVFESKINFNLCASHKTLCQIKDKLGIKEEEMELKKGE